MQEVAHLKYLSIHPDEKGQKVIASFAPEGATDAITIHELIQAINAAGFGGHSIHQTSLEEATAKYNSGEAFEMAVGEAVDGKFVIRLDDHLMAAYLSCTPPQGGAPVQRSSILQEAELKGITATLDLEAIDRALSEGGNNIQIASGKPVMAGADGKFEVLFPCMKEKNPHLDEHGMADFRELGEIVTVCAGDKLMRIVAPTNGEPGETVTGNSIPVIPGKKVIFASKLDGAALDPADPDLLIAAISGCPVLLKDGVSVEPVYTVKDVDLHTGNISFMGTVHVSGDVHVDMSIKASGDIYVDGTVENALLEAGGDIVVKGGIIGASELHANLNEKFQAAIKCAGSCTARFVQNAHISAESGIFIHDIAMLSELTAGHQIIVGGETSRKGDIIGGITRATMLVKARNIGSSSGLKTVVIAGADQSLHEQLNAAVKAREAAEHKLADIIKLLELIRLNPGRIPPGTVKTAEATRDALNAEIETFKTEEIELNNKISLADGAQVIVEKHVFGGAEIRIGLEHYTATEPREGGVFHISEDKLVFD
ncbi:MAG: FapA family protein [Gallionella sp.]